MFWYKYLRMEKDSDWCNSGVNLRKKFRTVTQQIYRDISFGFFGQ